MKNLLLVFSFVCLMFCKSFSQEKFVIETSFGEITFILYDETPLHKENFERQLMLYLTGIQTLNQII